MMPRPGLLGLRKPKCFLLCDTRMESAQNSRHSIRTDHLGKQDKTLVKMKLMIYNTIHRSSVGADYHYGIGTGPE
jgi:hypothetical protein